VSLGPGLLLAVAGLVSAADAVDGGRQIYTEGRSSRAAPINASLGRDSVPATLLPCIQCHGADGRGRSEGGVRPADIRPATLARALRDERRQRPAYDTAHLRRAITMGIDAGGQPLDVAMPRYALSLADADELLAYIAKLDSQAVPGVSERRIRIALRSDLPLAAPDTEIYARRIELVAGRSDVLLAIDTSADGGDSLRAAARDGVPTLVFDAGTASLGENGFAVTASADTQRAAAQRWAAATGGIVLEAGCDAAAAATAKALALTQAAAARCDIARLANIPGRPVRVFLGAPPDAGLRLRVMQAVLALVAEQLRGIGRDLAREKVLAALETVQGVALADLPALSWSAERRRGLQAVWVMQLDNSGQRWMAEPGWVDVDDTPIEAAE
jgi:cytochrome c553